MSRDFWLKKLLPSVFLGVLLALSARTCTSESASTEVVFQVGDEGHAVQDLHAELNKPGEDGEQLVGYFDRHFEAGSPAIAGRWPIHADPGMYTLRVDVTLQDRVVPIERRIEVRDGAVVTVDLERDLRGR